MEQFDIRGNAVFLLSGGMLDEKITLMSVLKCDVSFESYLIKDLKLTN